MIPSDRPTWVQVEYERIGRERERASREAERIARWALVRVCLTLIAWTVGGLLVAAVAFHVHDRELGLVFLYAGMIVNCAGVLWTVASAYRRGEARGDW